MEAALQPIEDVLKKIPGSLDVWTEVINGVRTVDAVHYLDQTTLIALFSEVKGDRYRLYTKSSAALESTSNAEWLPLGQTAPGWILREADISRIWVARPADRRQSIFSSRAENFVHQILVLAGSVLYTVTVDDTSGYPYKFAAVEHLHLPDYIDADSLQVAWNPHSQIVVTAFGNAARAEEAGVDGGAPKILPLSDAEKSKSKALYYHSPALGGWRSICSVGSTAEYLSLSGYGNRCVWREMLCAEAPEEAERGDFFGADVPAPVLSSTEQGNVSRRGFGQIIAQRGVTKTQLTQGAGRVDWARLNADGTAVALLANFEKKRPITTHRDLFLLEWPAIVSSRGTLIEARGQSNISTPIRVTDPGLRSGGSIEDFGWVHLHHESRANLTISSDDGAGFHTTSFGAASREVVTARQVGKSNSGRAEAMLWTSEIQGCERVGHVLHLLLDFSTSAPPSLHSVRLHDLACAPISNVDAAIVPSSGSGSDGPASLDAIRDLSFAYGTESDVLWPHVCSTQLSTTSVPLRRGLTRAESRRRGGGGGGSRGESLRLHPAPHNNQIRFDDLSVEKVLWKADDGQALEGLLFERRASAAENPLLVNAHGGPAVAFAADRTAAANSTRYPFRHFLKAGYRVFQPLYRGTLGYGDDFAQANICKQGQVDLADIASGVRHLLANHPRVNCPVTDVGIFGGSYGGYLTLRALSKLRPGPGERQQPFKFVAGVAEYGFLHNRWMSYEGGDFTWENEYQGDSTKFPASDCSSDVFDDLSQVRAPCLLMHGEDDDVCPVSQSRVGYNILRHTAKVPTGLIVYPGEGHGFSQPAHRRDRDRRMLVWFLTYVPCVPPAEQTSAPAGSPAKASVEAVAELEGRELHPHELALKMQSIVADTWGTSLREAFLAVDKNRDGIIDRRELEALLARQNLNQFPAETAAMLDQLDENGDGRLDYVEFAQMLAATSQEQARVSEAQDGYRQPATNFYEREAQRQAAQRAREEAEAARWSQGRAFAGANTASSVILGSGSSENGPRIDGARDRHHTRKFAGANTASSLTFGDEFSDAQKFHETHSHGVHGDNKDALQTPAKPSIRTGAFAGANTASSVTFGGPESSQKAQESPAFDPSNFVSSRAGNKNRNASAASADDDVAASGQLLKAKKFAGRNAASSIQFTGDGLVSANEKAPGALSSVRTMGSQRNLSRVAIDQGQSPDFARKGAANPAEFLSRVAQANASPRHGQRRRDHFKEAGAVSPRRARSPPRERAHVDSSLTVRDGALVSAREDGPKRPVRALSPGKTQSSQYEIAQEPGPVPYRQLRKGPPEHSGSRSSDPATFLSHANRGEHVPPPRSHSRDPVDPARVQVGRVQAAAAGSKYTPPPPKGQADIMMRHEPGRHAKVNRFAGRSQASKVILNPEEAANKPNTPRSTRRHVGEPSKSSLIFG